MNHFALALNSSFGNGPDAQIFDSSYSKSYLQRLKSVASLPLVDEHNKLVVNELDSKLPPDLAEESQYIVGIISEEEWRY